MGELTGGTVPARIWKEVMTVATEPYGNADFEYPEVELTPFQASSVSVIPTKNDANKKDTDNSSAVDNSGATKVDTGKPTDTIQQTITSIKKKEAPKIDVKDERFAPVVEQFAPIPVTSAPIGQ
jgi:membrane peptidoglycan carboxypeptidase